MKAGNEVDRARVNRRLRALCGRRALCRTRRIADVGMRVARPAATRLGSVSPGNVHRANAAQQPISLLITRPSPADVKNTDARCSPITKQFRQPSDIPDPDP